MEDKKTADVKVSSEKKTLEENNRLLKHMLICQRVTVACVVLMFVCIFITTLAVVNMQPQINKAVSEVTALVSTAEESVEEVNSVIKDIQTLVTDAEDLIPDLEKSAESISEISKSLQDEGLNKLYESLDNLNKIDIETLNNSINGLSSVVSPLAALFGKK